MGITTRNLDRDSEKTHRECCKVARDSAKAAEAWLLEREKDATEEAAEDVRQYHEAHAELIRVMRQRAEFRAEGRL